MEPTDRTERNKRKPGSPVRYSDATKELAYELWMLQCAEKPICVQRELQSGNWGEPLDISNDTIALWAKEYEWKQRKSDDLKRFAPSIREFIFGEMLLTAKELVEKVRANVQTDTPIDKSIASLTVQYLDRVGFSPVGKNDTTKVLDDVKPATRAIPENLADLTPEELMRVEEQFKTTKTRRA